jgi:hypothetical protein
MIPLPIGIVSQPEGEDKDRQPKFVISLRRS